MFRLRSVWNTWLLALVSALALGAQAAPPKKWTIVDLGALGPFGSRAFAVNNRGDVAGQTTINTGAPIQHAFLWQNGVMMDLGVPAPGTHQSVAFGITDKGTIVGTDGTNQGYVWKDGAWTQLPFMGGPVAINKFEHIVGNYETGVLGAVHGYLYRNGVFFDLPPLPGATGHSNATAINDHGLVVGSSSLPGAQRSFQAVAWENGVARALGTLSGDSRANGVNNRGTIVGTANDWRNVPMAFVYEGGVFRTLFTFGISSAVAINDRGAIVGNVSQGAEGVTGAFLYEDGKVTILNELPEVKAAGWSFLVPFAINDRGWIVGGGGHSDGSVSTAFLLIPR
jgi:probable HAF family extracellular repeat protein